MIPRVADVAQRGGLVWLDLIICWFVIIVLVVLTMSLSLQVVARYVFDAPTVWSEELAISLFVWLSMLAIPLGFRRGEHLAIDVLSKRLRPTLVKIISSVVSALSALTVGAIGYFALQLLPNANRQLLSGIAEGLGIPAKVSWVYAAVPLGCIIAVIFIGERLWAVWTNRVLVLNADADIQAIEQLENDLSQPESELPRQSGVSKANAESAWSDDTVSTVTYVVDTERRSGEREKD